MKEIIENPTLEDILRITESKKTVFLCPSLVHREKEYYTSIFKQYAPKGTVSFLTSGSSGNPKIIVHSWENLLKRAKAQIASLSLNSTSHYYSPLPIYHLGGFMPILRSSLSGASTTIKNEDSTLIEDVLRVKPTHTSLVPTQLAKLLDENLSLPFLESLLLGGASCLEEHITKSHSLGYPLQACYGMTETAGFFAISERDEFLANGKFNLKIMEGWKVFTGDDGRITVDSSEMFLGHITGKGFTPSGSLFPSFDVGEVDYPYIKIMGRSDLVFKSGGIKVDPLEVEKKIEALIGTPQVVVVPRKDLKWGQITCAFISPFHDDIDYFELTKSLPPHQRPKHFFPLKSNGGIKPKRSKLKKDLELMLEPPKMLFLHGFMGTKSDLKSLGDKLSVKAYYWELPYHDENSTDKNFEEVIDRFTQEIIRNKIDYIYGYSMGGRLTLALANKLTELRYQLKGIILESCHPGLEQGPEKEKRKDYDNSLFEKMPNDPETFFKTWYEQSLFGNFKDIPAGRAKIENAINRWVPKQWQKALSLMTLGEQRNYCNFIKDGSVPILYLYGENDLKYKEIICTDSFKDLNHLTIQGVPNAYHNIHIEHEELIIQNIKVFISKEALLLK